jgi:ribose 5-phosphate isomerase B
MKISIGSDHRGVQVRKELAGKLERWNHQVKDLGTHSTESCDYPDIAAAVAKSVASDEADRGILICGTGIGMAMAANKVCGIRAAVCGGEHAAEMSRRHNDANVLCLSADQLESQQLDKESQSLEKIVQIWLATEFDGGRHQRRVDKISKIASDQKRQSSTC